MRPNQIQSLQLFIEFFCSRFARSLQFLRSTTEFINATRPNMQTLSKGFSIEQKFSFQLLLV